MRRPPRRPVAWSGLGASPTRRLRRPIREPHGPRGGPRARSLRGWRASPSSRTAQGSVAGMSQTRGRSRRPGRDFCPCDAEASARRHTRADSRDFQRTNRDRPIAAAGRGSSAGEVPVFHGPTGCQADSPEMSPCRARRSTSIDCRATLEASRPNLAAGTCGPGTRTSRDKIRRGSSEQVIPELVDADGRSAAGWKIERTRAVEAAPQPGAGVAGGQDSPDADDAGPRPGPGRRASSSPGRRSLRPRDRDGHRQPRGGPATGH